MFSLPEELFCLGKFFPKRRPLTLEVKPDSKQNQQRGLTLVELLIVLAILVGLGGLLSVTLSSGAKVVGRDGVERTDEEVATTATMQTVRDALIGASPTEPGYRQDLGDLPSRLGALIENIDSEDVYDPARKRGWRGPYVFD
ncbi:MAG: type II secretion system protein, partial [Verrucomicrobiota bacterium]